MQIGMWTWVGPGNIQYIGVDDHIWRGTFGGVWPIEKHCKASDFGGGQKQWCAQKELILMIYTLYDVFLHKKLTFGVTVIVPALKFSGVNF